MNATPPPHPFDVQLGRTVLFHRKALGMNQTRLAGACGVTFQQVQKYERGTNRISCSTLMDIANALGVPAATLLGQAEAADRQLGGLPDIMHGDGLEAAIAISAIPDAPVRRQMINLMKVIAGEAPTSSDSGRADDLT